MPLKAIDFDTWITMMKIPICAVDELMLFMLCKIHDRHAMIFMDSKLWTTVEEGHNLSMDELYNICDIHLVYLGEDMYGELKCLFGDDGQQDARAPQAIFRTVASGKTTVKVPTLEKLCQETLKCIGTQK